MFPRRLLQFVYLIPCLILLGLWHLWEDTSGPPVHQTLKLDLDLPRSMKDRDVIVKRYIHNLQSQLEDKAVQYQEEEKSVYQKRNEYTKNFCKGRPSRKIMDPNYIRDSTWYIDSAKVMYCPVAKAGSTFWRRALEVMRRKDPAIVSPFQLSYLDFKDSTAKIPINYTEPKHRDDLSNLLKGTLKFVFARDPYHRVFSTYIDKILSPLSYMWGFGKKAIMNFRFHANATTTCGSDVTFEEYIKYINKQDTRNMDVHIKPVAHTCDVCDISYDVIGKMETFQTDTRYILKKAQSYGRDIIFKDMSTEYKVDHIVDNVIRAFSFKNTWNGCISVHAGLQRLWRQLQIGGVIDKRNEYPLTQEQSNNISLTEYLNMALLAFRRSSLSAKRNKREAFLQAYSTVSVEEMEKLRTKYIADLEMFNYEQRPEELFKAKEGVKGNFDYFDVMWLK